MEMGIFLKDVHGCDGWDVCGNCVKELRIEDELVVEGESPSNALEKRRVVLEFRVLEEFDGCMESVKERETSDVAEEDVATWGEDAESALENAQEIGHIREVLNDGVEEDEVKGLRRK